MLPVQSTRATSSRATPDGNLQRQLLKDDFEDYKFLEKWSNVPESQCQTMQEFENVIIANDIAREMGYEDLDI